MLKGNLSIGNVKNRNTPHDKHNLNITIIKYISKVRYFPYAEC